MKKFIFIILLTFFGYFLLSGFAKTSQAATTIASDTFTRTLTNTWGSASLGGAYSYTGTVADFDTNGSLGTISIPFAGSSRKAMLPNVSVRNTETTFSFSTNKLPIGGRLSAYAILRNSSNSEYRARVGIDAAGAVYLATSRIVSGGVDTAIKAESKIAGLTLSPNTYLNVRVQAVSTNPTTVQMKTWLQGQAEPSSFQYISTDSTPELQTSGSPGLMAYLQSIATNAPVLLNFDNLGVTDVITISSTPSPTPNPSPTPTPTETPTPTPGPSLTPTPTPSPIPSLTPSPTPTPIPNQTIVSLTFDDGILDQYTQAKPILLAHGMKGTFYIISGYVSNVSGYLTWQQITDLANDGNEIGGHTINHPHLPSISSDEAARQICNGRVGLLNKGFSVSNFAYPYGEYNSNVEFIVNNCGYNTARIVGNVDTCPGCLSAETIPPPDPFATRSVSSIKTETTLAQIKSYVTNAESHGGGWVQLVFHHVCDNACDPNSITPANFSALLDWLAPRSSQGTIVKTVDQVIGGGVKPAVNGPAAQPPDIGVTNPSLEQDLNNNNQPDCWINSGYGTNAFTFTRTSDAHTGSWGEKLNVTSYTSGDRRLVIDEDQGTCTPSVVVGHKYTASIWYKSSVPVAMTFRYRDTFGAYRYWTSSPTFPAASVWTKATYLTPAVPADMVAVSFGMSLTRVGTLTTDDYDLIDQAP